MVTPVLSDSVITLRPWRTSDVPALAVAYASLDVPPSFEPRRVALTTADAESFIAGRVEAWARQKSGSFAIESAHDGSLLGACSVALSGPTAGRVGYWLAAPARGHGYLARALALLIPWATGSAGVRVLHIITRPANAASRKAAEAAGFVLVGKSTEMVRGTPRQVVRYEYDAD